MNRIKESLAAFGWPRLIIAGFLAALLIAAAVLGLNPADYMTDIIGRFGMYLVLVLSLIPMIKTGCGLNFGLPLGIVAGCFGSICSIEMRLTGFSGIFVAMLIGALVAIGLGVLYAAILNRVKGDEMIIATYIGLSVVAFMSIVWVKIPFKNPILVWGYGGSGMRTSIGVEDYWANAISNIGSFTIGGVTIPTGMFLFGGLLCFFVWSFFHTKLGTSMIAVGSNPSYAKAAGLNINKTRTIAVVLSTVLAAIGIIVYQQSYTFIQLYQAPFNFTFPAVAAILIGGAAVNRASIKNVLLGVFLYQGIVIMAPMVINEMISDMSEVVRMIIANGMILYALTRKAER